MSFELRDYQWNASHKGSVILEKYKLLIINFEVRTGKTHIALEIARKYNNVLFLTKKKAIKSIWDDYIMAGHDFPLTVINYESIHKIEGEFDLVICDESHCLASFPKPSNRAIQVAKKALGKNVILITGTLLPESNAQIYHQLWVSSYSPFQHVNFYKWHKVFGTPAKIYTSYGEANDYSKVDYRLIAPYIDPIKITYTQKQAGFNSEIKEVFHTVDMKPKTYELIKRLKKDLVIKGKEKTLLADTGVKLMSKVHQLYSGTVKFEDETSQTIDYSKVEYIVEHFKGKKLAIFYKFKEELNAIKKNIDVTDNVEEFNKSDKNIALQFVSGREGINLSKADIIVAYNIDYSAVTYWQFRDRMTTKDRKYNEVHWLFSRGGLENRIYQQVKNKKNFTLQTFKSC